MRLVSQLVQPLTSRFFCKMADNQMLRQWNSRRFQKVTSGDAPPAPPYGAIQIDLRTFHTRHLPDREKPKTRRTIRHLAVIPPIPVRRPAPDRASCPPSVRGVCVQCVCVLSVAPVAKLICIFFLTRGNFKKKKKNSGRNERPIRNEFWRIASGMNGRFKPPTTNLYVNRV
jgi:hypothetical protein